MTSPSELEIQTLQQYVPSDLDLNAVSDKLGTSIASGPIPGDAPASVRRQAEEINEARKTLNRFLRRPFTGTKILQDLERIYDDMLRHNFRGALSKIGALAPNPATISVNAATVQRAGRRDAITYPVEISPDPPGPQGPIIIQKTALPAYRGPTLNDERINSLVALNELVRGARSLQTA